MRKYVKGTNDTGKRRHTDIDRNKHDGRPIKKTEKQWEGKGLRA